MKQCSIIREQFDDRLDGRLTDRQAAVFESHLAACATCRQEWQAEAGAWQLVARQPAVEPSVGFAQRTLRRVHETPAPAPAFWRWPAVRWATAASLFALVAVGGVLAWRQARTADQVAIYQSVQQDRLEDFDVIASLDQLKGDSRL